MGRGVKLKQILQYRKLMPPGSTRSSEDIDSQLYSLLTLTTLLSEKSELSSNVTTNLPSFACRLAHAMVTTLLPPGLPCSGNEARVLPSLYLPGFLEIRATSQTEPAASGRWWEERPRHRKKQESLGPTSAEEAHERARNGANVVKAPRKRLRGRGLGLAFGGFTCPAADDASGRSKVPRSNGGILGWLWIAKSFRTRDEAVACLAYSPPAFLLYIPP